MIKILLGGGIIAIVLVLLVTALQPMEQNQSQEEVASAETALFTLAEVSAHRTADDCWMVIDGKVYDVTRYIERGIHPGGEVILEGCGIDATQLFIERPSDGSPHSQSAIRQLESFLIGELSE